MDTLKELIVTAGADPNVQVSSTCVCVYVCVLVCVCVYVQWHKSTVIGFVYTKNGHCDDIAIIC